MTEKTEVKREEKTTTAHRKFISCPKCGVHFHTYIIEENLNIFESGRLAIFCGPCSFEILKDDEEFQKIKDTVDISKFSYTYTYPAASRKQEYQKYLNSKEWKKKRKETIEAAGGKCQLCNSDHRLHVHHRTYDNVRNEQPGDLIVLCSNCHAKFHDKLK